MWNALAFESDTKRLGCYAGPHVMESWQKLEPGVSMNHSTLCYHSLLFNVFALTCRTDEVSCSSRPFPAICVVTSCSTAQWFAESFHSTRSNCWKSSQYWIISEGLNIPCNPVNKRDITKIWMLLQNWGKNKNTGQEKNGLHFARNSLEISKIM